MNVIFTCGGTGGHINPAIAVAKLVEQRRPESNILFVGAEDGMEKDLVPREGFRLETLKISNFQRRLTPAAVAHNAVTAAHLCGSLKKADRIIKDFKPDVIVGTGGYASYPMLRQGTKRGIPTALHESNAVPGLTTRMVEKNVDVVMVCYEDSRSRYTNPHRVVVTGMPVRDEFVYLSQGEAKARLGLDSKPLVVSYWGSLGAREMNKKIARFIKLECEKEPFNHIHATGSFGWRWMPQLLRDMDVELDKHPSVRMLEYIYDMPVVMAAADLVICRAGASTLGELAAAGAPAIIIPSPNVADNHQEPNARIFEKAGAAEVMLEKDCDGERLYSLVTKLLGDAPRLRQMHENLSRLVVLDAVDRIYDTITALADKKPR